MKSHETKRFWEPMKLSSVGHVSQVIEVSEGKITPAAVDEGDNPFTKPPGQG